jgi:two-component system sensor histidine kinase/response regulator
MEPKTIEILIVEDSLTQAEILKYILENNNYSVRHAIDGQKALEILNQFVPDIIISDIVMPGIDGYHFCSIVKANDRLKKIPVILLTALSDPRDVIKGLECGADSFLVKPYSEEFLIARIQYFLQNSELRKNQTADHDLKILFANQNYTINSSPRQLLDILLTNYENSILKNEELLESNKKLKTAQDNLTRLNASLEQRVKLRTRELENSNKNLVEEIEEHKRAEEELIKAKLKAEECDRLKSSFLANMSHEIRTPLNSIIGFSELMTDADYDPSQQYEFARMIYVSGNNLLTIISDIMDISKIEAGQVNITKKMLSVNQLITNIQNEYSVKATEKGIEFRLDQSNPKEEVFIESDETKLRQILVNLVGNSIKFTEKGFIELGIKTIGDFVQFHVKDTGIGISCEFHDKIFERFLQVESTFTRKYGGVGLGLPISKSLVELLGGTIRMESELGKGSTFYFLIPISEKQAAVTADLIPNIKASSRSTNNLCKI